MFEDLFDDLIENDNEPNPTQTESCEDECDQCDPCGVDNEPECETDPVNPWEKVWRATKKAWHIDDEEDKSWDA